MLGFKSNLVKGATGNNISRVAILMYNIGKCLISDSQMRLYFPNANDYVATLLHSGKFQPPYNIMTSSNGNIFRVNCLLWGESTGKRRWIPVTKTSEAELGCFLWSALEHTAEANTPDAGDLRCHGAGYDVTVMAYLNLSHATLHSLALKMSN